MKSPEWGDTKPEWGDAILIYFIQGDGEAKRLGTPDLDHMKQECT